MDRLAFRIGDVYIVTGAGDNLNVRDAAGLAGRVVRQERTGGYVQIIDGLVVADGYTWWKIGEGFGEGSAGWVVEDPTYYERAWGQ